MLFGIISPLCPMRAQSGRTHSGCICRLLYVPGAGISVFMKLQDYLKRHGLTVSQFAVNIREKETTIRKIVYGQRQPSLTLSVKINEATEGKVTGADLIVTPAAAA